MATLTNGAVLSGEITITKRVGTLLTLATEGKYADKDAQFTIGVQSAAAAANTAAADADVESTDSGSIGGTNISNVIGAKSDSEPSSGYYIRVKATGSGSSKVTSAGWLEAGSMDTASTTATKFFPVDAASVAVSGSNTVTPSASISGTNVTLSNTNNGISVTSTGGGTASASAAATSTAAGYVPNNTQMGSATINAGSVTTTASTFISGVTIEKPSTGTRTFAVTVPNGNSTVTFTFNVDSSGNVVIS